MFIHTLARWMFWSLPVAGNVFLLLLLFHFDVRADSMKRCMRRRAKKKPKKWSRKTRIETTKIVKTVQFQSETCFWSVRLRVFLSRPLLSFAAFFVRIIFFSHEASFPSFNRVKHFNSLFMFKQLSSIALMRVFWF